MMIKPVSSRCNLHCDYCYYSGKLESLSAEHVMSHEVLEEFTKDNIVMHGRNAVIEFAWHGGEPLLAGLDFFRDALNLQKRYGEGRKILNTLQTNATLLDDSFCEFFRENNFLLGVSIDGPEEIHNIYRNDSFSRVMKGIELLRKHNVTFNTLTAVNNINSKYPRELYFFLRELTGCMQFLPVVESLNTNGRLSQPSGLYASLGEKNIASFSVEANQWGKFLCEILELWIKYDSGRKHVQLIDSCIENMKGIPCSLCVHNPLCGHSGCVESNGDVYSCDRYAFHSYYLGNIMNTNLKILMDMNKEFGMHKTYGLNESCFECPYIKLCFGGCPKDRMTDGKNYLCEGYMMFFSAIKDIELKYGLSC